MRFHSPSYRLAILADIHGNLPALEAVLADLQQFAPLDGLLVAGDTTTGPHQEIVLDRLREIGAMIIQGNGEHTILEMAAGSAPDYFRTAKQFSLGRWAFSNYTPAALAFIQTLPEQLVFSLPGADPIRLVHGSPRRINEGIFPQVNPAQLADVLELVAEPVFICAHTHQNWQIQVNGRLALNPGAVCGPLNGQVGAQYALLEWHGAAWRADLRCIPYDLQAIARAFVESGLLDTGYLARAFLTSIFSGNNITNEFISHAFDLSKKAGDTHLPYIPDEIWDQAGATFPWPGFPFGGL